MPWPSTLSSFTDPASTERLNNPSHSSIESAQNTGLEEIQTFVGTLSSAVGTIMYDVRAAASSGGGHVQAANVGGTGQTSYAKGDLLVATSASVIAKLAVGSNAQILTADSNQSSGIKWADTTINPLFLSAGEFNPNNTTYNSSVTVGVVGQRGSLQFKNGMQGEAATSFRIPSGIGSIATISAIFKNGGATNVFVNLQFLTSVSRIGSNDVTSSTTAANFVTSSTAGAFSVLAGSAAWSSLTVPLVANDIIGLNIIRNGAAAGDTLGADLEFEGAIVTLS